MTWKGKEVDVRYKGSALKVRDKTQMVEFKVSEVNKFPLMQGLWCGCGCKMPEWNRKNDI